MSLTQTTTIHSATGSPGLLRRAWWWLLNDPRACTAVTPADAGRIDWMRAIPFIAVHALVFTLPWVGVSATGVALAVVLYITRMFLVTAVHHRYFSHCAFRMSRAVQFVAAVLACTAGQRGPLWWAGHHREHHVSSDTELDPHSPRHRGRLFSHTLWFLTRGSFATPVERIRNWLKYPELRWLERLDWVPFLALGLACYALGAWLESSAPALGVTGPQLFVWGFGVSTVALYHATYTINSLAHGWGSQRFETGDDSRNNPFLALLTLGEGWHNNHHHFPASARQGFYWWEIDLSYAALKALSWTGLVQDLRPVPGHVLAAGRTSPRSGR